MIGGLELLRAEKITFAHTQKGRTGKHVYFTITFFNCKHSFTQQLVIIVFLYYQTLWEYLFFQEQIDCLLNWSDLTREDKGLSSPGFRLYWDFRLPEETSAFFRNNSVIVAIKKAEVSAVKIFLCNRKS